jgi:hypothetical protein
MRRVPLARAVVVVGLAIAMVDAPGFAGGTAAAAMGGAGLRGVMYGADGKSGIRGARVTLLDPGTGRPITSGLTREDGVYALAGLTGGTYDLLIESAGASFRPDRRVELLEGRETVASFALQPGSFEARSVTAAGGVAPGGRAAAGHGRSVGGGRFAGGPGFWNRPGGLLLIDILATGTVLVLKNNVGHNASPSAP